MELINDLPNYFTFKDETMGKRRSEINGPKEPSTGPNLDFESAEEAIGINSKERDFLAFLA